MADNTVSLSLDLLKPPEGAGVTFVTKELGTRKFEGKQRMRQPPNTFRVEKSSVLGRVQSFLPQLAHADNQLQQQTVSSECPHMLDIENVNENEPHIEMDLAVIPLSSEPEDERVTSSDSSSGEEVGDDEMVTFPLRLPNSTRHKKRTAVIEELPCR